jgi:hypothetical protein
MPCIFIRRKQFTGVFKRSVDPNQEECETSVDDDDVDGIRQEFGLGLEPKPETLPSHEEFESDDGETV